MNRLLPAVVAVFLMLIFLALNQAIISNEISKSTAALSNTGPYGAAVSGSMPVDNDSRGAHSYFPPPRIFSARYPTTLAQSELAQHTEEPSENTVAISPAKDLKLVPVSGNAQDLLHSGYLPDNGAVYMPDFGIARCQ